MDKKTLTLSRDCKVAGVCGGLAEYFGFDPTLVRVAYALLTLLSAAFPGVLLYIICWIVMPRPNTP
ncbi:MAG: PspC domain-containing protein [Bacteroidaceae bacterium]|nr:PspC domain-containing protein [Bacteroidaceae bacterium]